MATNVFLSTGAPHTPAQESFLRAIEADLARARLRPQTVGRSVFDKGDPLALIDRVMRSCAGAVVVGFERVHITAGEERRGSVRARTLSNISLTTPWNQIETAMAYTLRLPILVIAEDGLRLEGLVDKSFGWRVIERPLTGGGFSADPASEAIFKSWRKAVTAKALSKGWLPTQFQIGERIDGEAIAARSVVPAGA